MNVNQRTEQLFHEFYSPLCNYAATYIRDNVVAEDIVQSLFIQLWENGKITSIKNPDRFLIRSIKFKCIDYLKSKDANNKINIDNIFTTASYESEELKEEDIEPLIHFFAEKLPPKAREIFLLSRKSGLKYREISEELNLSVKTVENQMGHALRKMRSILKEHNFLSLIPFL